MMKKFLVYLILLFLPLVFASNDVSVDLVTSGDDIWTRASTRETFSFAINNDNSTFSFNIVNITVPNGFSSPDDLGVSLVDWICENNSTTVSCYNETDPFDEEIINIWFDATSVVSLDEENVTWKVLLVNKTTGNNITIEVNSGIDGKPPQVNNIDMFYMGGNFEDGDDISQREPITVVVQAEDNGIGIDNVWVDVYDSSDTKVQDVVLSGESEFSGDILIDSLNFGTYSANISVNDSFDNLNISDASFSFTIIPISDLEVGEFTLDPPNPYLGQNLTVYADITKDGNCDENINITWSLNGSEYKETINCSNIDTTKEVNHTFVGFSGKNNVSLMVDSEYDVSESLENNNYQSQIISTNLNITILNASLSNLQHNETLTLNVSVKYWNDDTLITDLSLSNFEIYDKWDLDNYRNKSEKIFTVDATLASYGIYLVNYTVPEISEGILEYGEHNMKVEVNKVNYSTNSSNIEYFMNGPNLAISYSGDGIDGYDLDNRDNATFNITVTNTGNRVIYGVSLTIETTEGDITEDDDCNSANQNITPGDSIILCEDVVIKSSQDFILTSVATGTYNSTTVRYQYNNYNVEVDSKDTSSDSEEGSNDINEEDTFNSGKSSGGGAATTTTVKKKYLTITEYPEKVEIEQGKRKTINIEVKNEDDWEFQDVTLKVIEINSSWITVIPANAVEIEPLKTKEYRITFEISEDAEIKDYSGEFQASSSFETKKQSFTLSVIPGPDLQLTINSTIEDYQNQIQQLEDEIDTMKNKGYNITEAEQKLKELKDEFNKLLTYRDGGNYKSAYGLLGNTGNLLNQTTSILSGAIALPTVLLGVVESKWVLSGLFGVLFIVGAYTFWGRHYDIEKRILKKLKRKTKTNFRNKDLENIAKGIRGEELRTLEKIEKATEVKPETSDRMKELELIKNLATSG